MARRRNLLHPRDELMLTMERIYRHRMTTTSGGNLSLRDEQGMIWITPARVDKGNLRRTDMVCVRPDGAVEGTYAPSSEFPFHRAIFQARPELKGIVHAHPVALVAFSMIRQSPDPRLFHQAWGVCGPVGFAPYALPGSAALARNIADTFAQGFACVVLENHGVVVAGETLQQAFERFETLEFAAKTTIKSRLLGQARLLTDEQLAQARLPAVPFTGVEPGEPSSREKELRRQVTEFVKRGYQQRLLISTQGSFSARVDEESFLITPYQGDRYGLDLEDLVLVKGDTCEAGKVPSRASRAHQALYKRHPSLHAIVNAYPVNATAFSVTGAALETRTIPESYLFLRDVQRIPFGMQFSDPKGLAELISPKQPVAILENDGVLVAGTSVLDAFDRLEVLESTAEALINSRPLGDVVPMPDAVIDELTQAFFPNG